MIRLGTVPLLALMLITLLLPAQSVPAKSVHEQPAYSRLNSFGAFGEYSNDSGHMLLGQARQRKLLDFGLSYSRRIFAIPFVDLQYLAEVRPVLVESDPVQNSTTQITFPTAPQLNLTSHSTTRLIGRCGTGLISTFTGTYKGDSYTETTTATSCTREWTFGQGLNPVGIRLNFAPHHRLQPVFSGLGGYMFSTHPIPVDDAGSANFTFEFGTGFEFYLSKERSPSLIGNRSIRAEYRYHHISNNFTAQFNPGIDNGLLQVTYAFGR